MQGPKIRRLYYSTKEVSEIVHISPQILKDWELTIPNLKPTKSKSGRRMYKPEDMKAILKIKEWKDSGHSDEEINRLLKSSSVQKTVVNGGETKEKKSGRVLLLYEISNGLRDILHILE